MTVVEDEFRVAYEKRFKAPANVKRLILGMEGTELLGKERHAQYVKLVKRLESLKKQLPTTDRCLCVTEAGRQGPETFVLVRGNPHVKGDKVEPGFPSVFGLPSPALQALPEKINSSGRRTVLANWIASPDNPLTARVMANRIWQHHFGRGIVRSPNDYGIQGSRPTHPELLDWLASEFVAQGWKLKAMHRLMLTSSAYRISSKV